MRSRAGGTTTFWMAKDAMQAKIARISIGRITVMRGAPAALITMSSESVFIVESVCATAMPTANGSTIGMTDGSTSAASSRNVAADCPLVVTMFRRARICVVHTIASTQTRVATKYAVARRNM